MPPNVIKWQSFRSFSLRKAILFSYCSKQFICEINRSMEKSDQVCEWRFRWRKIPVWSKQNRSMGGHWSSKLSTSSSFTSLEFQLKKLVHEILQLSALDFELGLILWRSLVGGARWSLSGPLTRSLGWGSFSFQKLGILKRFGRYLHSPAASALKRQYIFNFLVMIRMMISMLSKIDKIATHCTLGIGSEIHQTV